MSTRTRKKHNKSSKSTRIIWLLATIALIVKVGLELRSEEKAADESGNITRLDYGNLMKVTTKPGTPEINKSYKGMDVSFNPQCHIPNWVSWELTAEETTGDESRSNKFQADPEVEGCAETWDYKYTGYDRGHMAPAADMKWDKEAMVETFYLTNIVPQAKTLNAGSWKNLEEKCRDWAQADSCIYIVCGPVIDGSPIEYIGDTRVYVPKKFFKVIISPYTSTPMGIGFIMPNGKVAGGIQACAVTIDSIEALTGHDFFSSLPDDIEDSVEKQCDFHAWSVLKKKNKKK